MRNLQSVQCLRGVAALLVVFHHARNPQIWLFNPLEHFRLGQIGVDLFFVISGFIMYSVGRRESPAEFVRRRFVRIVPMYWIATAVLLAVNVNWHFEKLIAVPFHHIVASLLFIPHYSPDEPGRIWPYLIPGWTLNYEVFFYLVFTVGIAVRRPLLLTSIVFSLLVLSGLLIDSTLAPWRIYTDPVILEFLMGIFIAASVPRLPPAGLLFGAGIAGLFATEVAGLQANRFITWGLPCACLVAALVARDLRRPIPRLPLLAAWGDASYSIYLFQVVALAIASKLFARAPIEGVWQFVAFILLSLVCATTLGCCVYRYVEDPLLRRFTARSRERSAPLPLPLTGCRSAEADIH